MTTQHALQQEEILSKHDFYFETSLYEYISLSKIEQGAFGGDVDAYSAQNNSDTTYDITTEAIDVMEKWGVPNRIESGFYLVALKCKRKNNDSLRFVIYKDDKVVMKIGQFPSLADLQFAEIGKKYDGVLPKEDLKNLKKAIGLNAHGAGAGSFVYLRRIFENLIFETFRTHASELIIKEFDFKKQRMEEKVETLKTFLPSQLIEMKAIYAILSKGVHELPEEDCLRYFLPLKLSIELILDEKIEKIKKIERDALVKKQLQDIQKKIGK